MSSPNSATAELQDVLDSELRPALGQLHDARRARYRIVGAYAVVCFLAVIASSIYVTFELIGGDDAWLAFIPTLAFMAGVGVLITIFAYFIHVKMPLQKRFRAELLGPIVERITPRFRDESSAEMQRDEWRNSGLFPDSTHQLQSEHLTAARLDDLTAGFCHLKLDAELISPAGRSNSSSSGLLSGQSGFDGLFLVAKPAVDVDATILIEPRPIEDEAHLPDSSIELDAPPAVYESLYRLVDLEPEFDERFFVYSSEESDDATSLLGTDVRRRLVDVHRSFAQRDVDFAPIPPFVLSLRDQKCHIAIPVDFPSPPLRPRAPQLGGLTLQKFAHHLEFAFCVARALHCA